MFCHILRPQSSMMYIVSFALVCAVLVLIVVVDFVLANITMFQTPFDIVLRVPFSPWKHTWEDVPFMYLVGGSFLLGVLIIVCSVMIFDAKLKLKIRALRKEVKKLEQSVADAKSMLPKEDALPETKGAFTETADEQADITPEDVTKSFEDTIQTGNFSQAPVTPIAEGTPQDQTQASSPDEIEPEQNDSKEISREAEVLDAEVDRRRDQETPGS